MRIAKIWIGFILHMALFACSNDTHQVGDDPQGDASGYMVLHLTGEQPVLPLSVGESRAVGDMEVSESTIQKIVILLANENGQVVDVCMPKFVQTITGIYTEPFLVKEGEYEVYAIVNPSDLDCTQVFWKGKGVEEVCVQVMNEDETLKNYMEAGNFLMFSECGESGNGAVKITVTSEHTADNPAQGGTPIKVDRLAVKLSSVGNENGAVDIDGIEKQLKDITAAEMDGYVLLNGAKTAYLQQHWTTSPSSVTTEDVYILNSSGMKYEQVGDACFDDYYSCFENHADIQKEENLYTHVEDLLAGEKLSAEPLYCMENNSDNYRGNTTGLIYRWKATNGKSDRLAGENCFYGYNSEYFSTLQDLATRYPSAFGEDSYEAAVDLLKNQIARFRAKYQIKVYAGGNMYYTHYIKDKNHVNQDGDYYYAVMRNTVYYLNVTQLMKIGDDVPGGWEPHPEWPVDYSEAYMQVQVQVNPWLLSNTEIELN